MKMLNEEKLLLKYSSFYRKIENDIANVISYKLFIQYIIKMLDPVNVAFIFTEIVQKCILTL